GMAHALGYRFLDKNGNMLKPIGDSLGKIASVIGKPNKKIESSEFILASDVKNPLYGANGAAKVFAKQKGANEQEIEMLDAGLTNFANVMEKKFHKSIVHLPGAGAAGGLGAGAMLFLGAKQSSGVETIMKLLSFDKYLKNSDFVISGEGKFDKQTLEGKVVKGVIDKCSEYDKPMGIVCGISELEIKDLGKSPVKIITQVMNGKVDMVTAFSDAYNLVSQRAEELMRKYNKAQ
ncbi:MAG TPA: glycerate kinase, partial [Bacteroidetes bacterium]|nr:glycerate kinase [Bacteroidota bacterium]